jgi:Tfp pilus assembly protein PilX
MQAMKRKTDMFGQRGSALIVTLAILTALSLIGVSAITISKSNLRLAANLQFQNAAQNEAESALAVAENWISTNYSSTAFFGGTAVNGLYAAGSTIDPLTLSWTDANSIEVSGSNGRQRYLIEVFVTNRTLPSNSLGNCNTYNNPAPCPKVNVFRISARGTSLLGATRVVQTLFAARQNI